MHEYIILLSNLVSNNSGGFNCMQKNDVRSSDDTFVITLRCNKTKPPKQYNTTHYYTVALKVTKLQYIH